MRSMLLLLLFLVILISPVGAITGGSVDPGTVHPNVGIVVFRLDLLAPGFAQICSGTLISERVVLTAGHCVDAFQTSIATGLSSGIDQLSVNFVTPHVPAPVGGDNREVVKMILHPDYDARLVVKGGTDIGLLILKDPVVGITPATLPTVGLLDALKKAGDLKPKNTTFRAAGFGTFLDPVSPPTPTLGLAPFPRRYVDVRLKGLMPRYIQMSNSLHSGDGGSCFGDSGGPVFLTHPDTGARLLVGVTSWGDAKCVGTGAGARTDMANVLKFIGDNTP